MKVWILTSEYNDYDQYGEYFLAAFKNKPTAEQLKRFGIIHSSEIAHLLNEGGREKHENMWYNLKEEEAE